MNKITSLTAITMVAVILGMSTVVPSAIAAPNQGNGNATTAVCHQGGLATADPTDDDWTVIWVSGNGSLKGHLKHGDTEVTGSPEEIGTSAYWCITNNDGTVVDPT